MLPDSDSAMNGVLLSEPPQATFVVPRPVPSGDPMSGTGPESARRLRCSSREVRRTWRFPLGRRGARGTAYVDPLCGTIAPVTPPCRC